MTPCLRACRLLGPPPYDQVTAQFAYEIEASQSSKLQSGFNAFNNECFSACISSTRNFLPVSAFRRLRVLCTSEDPGPINGSEP
jgi:hypothetical protein